MTLLVCCVVTVVLAVGGAVGAMMFLSRTGKLGSGALPSTGSTTKKSVDVSTHAVTLEPLLINLSDEGGHAYLRLGVVLAEEDDPAAKPKEEAKPVVGADAAVRDTIFDVLGRQSSTTLLSPDGKDALKKNLMAAIALHNPELHVKTIYFTDFLVQQ
jgi:flagellar FliL protein